MFSGKIRFLINPISGAHPNPERMVAGIRRYMQKSGCELSFAVSTGPGQFAGLARQAVADGVERVVAVGGDGTVNEVAAALVGTDVAFGIVPNGSGNGLARHLGIPLHLTGALSVLTGGEVLAMDSCTLNGRPFFCTAGVGFDARVGMDYACSGSRGFITYARKALEDWPGLKPGGYVLTVDGERHELTAALITVANANQWGNGFHIAPKASVTDGLMDIVAVKTLKSLHTLDMPLQALGYSLDKNVDVLSFTGRNVEIEALQPDFYHLDGEPAVLDGKLSISILPGSLKVVGK